MSKGISNIEIEKLFKETNNDDLNESFLGVYPSEKINKFIMLDRMMPGIKCLFLISNTDRSNQGRTHWWSIMNISPISELFFFDSNGIEGMKHFIVSDDKKIVGKILKGIETIDQKDKNLTFCRLKFSMNAYERIKENETKKLSESAQELFHLIHSFRKNEQLTNFVSVWMLEDPMQMPKTFLMDFFKYIFTKTFFFPDKNSKTESYKNLTNNAIKTLLNKLFTLDRERNEQLINE